MATPGTQVTYTFSGAKETEDISDVDEIIIKRMNGAGGDDASAPAGNGGQITAAKLPVTNNTSAEIWIGEAGGAGEGGGGFGRSNGGDGGDVDPDSFYSAQAGGGGGSTELFVDGTRAAAADAGGGGADEDFGDNTAAGGGGGARGGAGGSGADADGKDAEGTGFGGDGGDARLDDAGKDGGQELAQGSLFDRGGTTSGGGNGGNTNAELEILYDTPLKPLSLTTAEDTSGVNPAVGLSWTNDAERFNRIYRSDVGSPSFPDDFVEVESVGEGVTTYTDSPPNYETTYTYRVTAESVGESNPSDPATITTSSEGELAVTITNTNSPVTTGDTLDLDVEVENIGDYRADENIDADLEPQ